MPAQTGNLGVLIEMRDVNPMSFLTGEMNRQKREGYEYEPIIPRDLRPEDGCEQISSCQEGKMSGIYKVVSLLHLSVEYDEKACPYRLRYRRSRADGSRERYGMSRSRSRFSSKLCVWSTGVSRLQASRLCETAFCCHIWCPYLCVACLSSPASGLRPSEDPQWMSEFSG